MKIRNILALAALSCMLVFSSCKKKNEIPDHLKVIPGNSSVVLSINAAELVEKGGLNDYKEFNMYKKAMDELKEDEPEAAKIMEAFLKDTGSSGLDLDQIFMYVQHIGEYENLTAFTFGVDNADKFGKWLVEFRKASKGEDDEEMIEEGNGYKSFRLEYSSLFVWNKTTALLLTVSEHDMDMLPGMESLLTIDEATSIIANKNFMESYNNRKDVTTWLSFKGMGDMMGMDEMFDYAFKTNPVFSKEDMDSASMDISLNFTNEKATLSASMWPATMVDKYFEKYPVLKNDFDESLLTYFPEQNFFVAKASVNVGEYYRALVDNFTALAEKAKAEGDSEDDDYSYSYYGNMASILPMITNDTVVKTVGLFKGDVLASIFGFKEGMAPIPQFAIATTVNEEGALEHLLGLLPKDQVTFTKADSYYSYSIPAIMDIFVAQKGGVIYLTDNKVALDNFLGKGYEKNLSTSAIAADIKSNYLLYHLNLNIDQYPALITMLMKQSMGSEGYGVLSSMLEKYTSLDMKYAGKNTVEMNLNTKDSKENSFKSIVKAIDKATKNFF